MVDYFMPLGQVAARPVAIIDGNRFSVSDALGDMVASGSEGLFCADTRFLSRYVLTVDGERLSPLTAGNVAHNAASFYGVSQPITGIRAERLSVVRDRYVESGLHDDVTLMNCSERGLEVDLTLEFGADFADIFEVRGAAHSGEALTKRGTIIVEAESERRLILTYRHGSFMRRTLIECSRPAQMDGAAMRFAIHLAAKERWQICVTVYPIVDALPEPMSCHAQQFGAADLLQAQQGDAASASSPGLLDRSWLNTVPQLESAHLPLQLAYDRAVADLDALRLTEDGHQVPAAGLPWFMAIFGRDSLITGYQTLLLGADLAKGALRTLAGYQARRTDDFRDEQPGKIPHEIRDGELSSLGEVPHSRYYGTVDATPLFLILLSETYRWTGDLGLVRELLPNAEQALTWIDRYGDLDGDGFVEYAQRSARGLHNQCWKDSGDSMRYRDGRLAEGPIASVEVQGYVYDAKLRLAELYESLGQDERAGALRTEAATLKRAFNVAFWMPDEGFYALALDGMKRQVDSVTSNPGHCLWSGIVDTEKAPLVAERLMNEDLFAGWGIRTMSTFMAAYDPISYHNGSIWPHDNSLIAAGLARYGLGEAASRVIEGMLAASNHDDAHRLPELFAGYRRRQPGFPVSYPGANAPQAWAAGAVILMLQTQLGITARDETLRGQPLPGTPALSIAGVPFQGRRVDIATTPQNGAVELRIADGVASLSH